MSTKSPRLWLVKSEPGEFSFQDLVDSPGKRTHWDGIRNYQVRNFIRDDIKRGDQILYYHSNAKPPGVVATAEVVKEAYADHTQFDPENKKFDPKSQQDSPTWLMFDMKAKRKLKSYVSLESLKSNPKLDRMLVVQRGQRLSIQPVTQKEWDEVLSMGGL
ncbi:MAG: putative RNA-binding protein with PUA-like domain [Candidatus Paceibacteria bacterium]|jgi:predicted RNA-binding protein with PUA-like domain